MYRLFDSTQNPRFTVLSLAVDLQMPVRYLYLMDRLLAHTPDSNILSMHAFITVVDAEMTEVLVKVASMEVALSLGNLKQVRSRKFNTRTIHAVELVCKPVSNNREFDSLEEFIDWFGDIMF